MSQTQVSAEWKLTSNWNLRNWNLLQVRIVQIKNEDRIKYSWQNWLWLVYIPYFQMLEYVYMGIIFLSLYNN